MARVYVGAGEDERRGRARGEAPGPGAIKNIRETRIKSSWLIWIAVLEGTSGQVAGGGEEDLRDWEREPSGPYERRTCVLARAACRNGKQGLQKRWPNTAIPRPLWSECHVPAHVVTLHRRLLLVRFNVATSCGKDITRNISLAQRMNFIS